MQRFLKKSAIGADKNVDTLKKENGMKFSLARFSILVLISMATGCQSNKNSALIPQLKEHGMMKNQGKINFQVIGLVWLNPLQRRDYTTEWQLLWTLGKVKPNKNDEMVRKEPSEFSTVQYVSLVADGNRGKTSILHYHQQYQYQLAELFHDNYFGDPEYFYNVHDTKRKKEWRELAGIHVEYALPTSKFDAVAAGKNTKELIEEIFAIGAPYRPTL